MDVGMQWCRATLGKLVKASKLGSHVYKLYIDCDLPRLYRPCDLPRENYATAADAPVGSWHLVLPAISCNATAFENSMTVQGHNWVTLKLSSSSTHILLTYCNWSKTQQEHHSEEVTASTGKAMHQAQLPAMCALHRTTAECNSHIAQCSSLTVRTGPQTAITAI
eukprot:9197-Heterococcus_DN1.PRE.4